jgi:hypothetical protein
MSESSHRPETKPECILIIGSKKIDDKLGHKTKNTENEVKTG